MNDDISHEIHKNKKKAKPLSILLTVGIGIIVVGLVAAVLFGVFYVGVKQPNQRVVVQASVCSSSEVLVKIKGYLSDITNSSEESTQQAKTKEAIGYIESQSNYDSDPTCVEALARFYFIQRDASNMSVQVDRLNKLAEAGKYPSNLLESLTGISTKEIELKNLTERSQ